MEFVLLKKLAKLEGTELWMFIGAIVAVNRADSGACGAE